MVACLQAFKRADSVLIIIALCHVSVSQHCPGQAMCAFMAV